MTDTKNDQPASGPRRAGVNRGLLIGAATAALVIIVAVVAFAFIADGDSRVLQLTFDGQQCTYQGPSVLSAGEIETVSHNASSEASWFWLGRLDEGRTTQEMVDYIADDPAASAPSWTVEVWLQRRASANSSSTPTMRAVAPGLHNMVCGPETPSHAYLGGELTVTP